MHCFSGERLFAITVGEHLFHSQMWVKGSPLQFIVDSGSQKNLISVEVVKRLGLLNHTTLHNCTPLGGFTKDEIFTSANNVAFPTTSSPSQMRYCVMFLLLKFVMYY
jgi:hypothetical protein